jgi:prepilin-type N-terminal cleavage/methylation domain-containing protein/prepilin-type processing-associated H-X9-DG protein
MRPVALPCRGGFTLVELLVAAAIVAVLAVAGAAAFQVARESANRAKCASNMRQLGMGLIAYAQENHGRLPATQHLTAHGSTASWVFALKGYFGGDIDDIRICPADPLGPERARNNASSYVMNDFLDGGRERTDMFGRTRELNNTLATIPDPSRTMMLFIVSDRKGTAAGNDHIHGAGWTSWGRVLADIQPDRHRRGGPNADHTRGSANYLYVDGRVQSIGAAEIKSRIERGINIAQPPK